jgi:glycosyltransferase involved in cell wall biosynthesis
VARFYAHTVSEKTREKNYDIVFSPDTIPIAFLNTQVPVVLWADATFNSLVTTNPRCRNRRKTYYEDGEELEQAAYARAALCVFSSEWAAESAREHYGIDARKVKVIPFGANVDDDESVTKEDVRAAINKRNNGKVRLLFAAVDFKGKGGPKVLEVLRHLLILKVPAELRILGCTPEIPSVLRPHVKVDGYISKRSEDGKRQIAEAFLSSHWLVVLSVAECYGLVFAEASRYGVPSVGNEVGGISTIIRDQSHGKLFPVNATSVEIAEYIASVSQTEEYVRMAAAAYRDYQQRLNWRAAGAALAACVQLPWIPSCR